MGRRITLPVLDTRDSYWKEHVQLESIFCRVAQPGSSLSQRPECGIHAKFVCDNGWIGESDECIGLALHRATCVVERHLMIRLQD